MGLGTRTSGDGSEGPYSAPALDKRDLTIAAGIFLAALFIYWRTLAPDLLFGDSGEFQVVAMTGGLGHASGYPIYLIIAKIFTFLPFGNVPERVSFVSTIVACSAVAKVFLVSRCLGVRKIFSAIAAVVLMISPLFWWQSIIAEVYTITADFFIGAILCALLWRHTRDRRWLAAGGLLGGLCFGLHHSVALALPFVLVYIALYRAAKRDWTFAVGGIVVGVVLAGAAYVIEGSVDNVTTTSNYSRPLYAAFGMKSPDEFDSPLRRIKFALFAEEFRADVFELSHVGPNVGKLAVEVQEDFGWTVPLFAVIGIIAMVGKRSLRREAVFIAAPFVLLLVFPLGLFAFDIEVEYIQAHVLMCVLAAVGLQQAQALVLQRSKGDKRMFAATAAAGIFIVVIGTARILAGVMPALAEGKPTFLTGVRREFPYHIGIPNYSQTIGQALVGSVPDGSMMMLEWMYVYDCYYVARNTNKMGVEIVAPFPEPPDNQLVANAMIQFLLESAKKRPLFADSIRAGLQPYFTYEPVLRDAQSGRVYLYRLTPKG